jgi:hypothetical protein
MQTRYQVLIKDGKLVACLHEAASAMAMANRLRDPEGGRVLDSWTGWTYYPLAGWINCCREAIEQKGVDIDVAH